MKATAVQICDLCRNEIEDDKKAGYIRFECNEFNKDLSGESYFCNSCLYKASEAIDNLAVSVRK